MSLPKKVKIVEVGPRDGLQHESAILPIDVRVNLIERLADTGLSVVEAGSFVSPKWIPQMADSGEVFKKINRKPEISYPVLVPNLKGLERALEAGVEEISVFTAASETFTQKNIHCSIKESLERYKAVTKKALAENLKVRGYISCVLGCPYEGEITPQSVIQVAKALTDMGCYEISLGDTIGVGTPLKAQNLIETVAKTIPISQLAAHFHDTYGQALANLFAVMQLGISVIDSSVTGLGGCPYAKYDNYANKGASGNVATEDVLYMLNGMGVETGVDMEKLLEVGRYIDSVIICNANSEK